MTNATMERKVSALRVNMLKGQTVVQMPPQRVNSIRNQVLVIGNDQENNDCVVDALSSSCDLTHSNKSGDKSINLIDFDLLVIEYPKSDMEAISFI